MVCLGYPPLCKFICSRNRKIQRQSRNYFVVAIAAVTASLALSMVPSVWNGTGQALTTGSVSWLPGISAGVYIDPLSVLFTCLIGFFALIIAVYSIGYMKGEEGLSRYYYLILLFIGSMIGLVLADNMLQMFIFWEMVGLMLLCPDFVLVQETRINPCRCQSFHNDPHRRHRSACSHRHTVLDVWYLELPRRNSRHSSRRLQHGLHGYRCIPSFRRRNRKISPASTVHMAI